MLMIGTNNIGRNSAEEIAEGIGAVVLMLRKCFPESRILLLGVFPRGTANDPVRQTIREINQTISKLDDGEKIHYLDIGARLLNPDGSISAEVMSDGLHPTSKGYEIWAEAVASTLTKLMDREPAQKVIPEGALRGEVRQRPWMNSAGRFALAPLGEFLERDVAGSLQSAALFLGGETGSSSIRLFLESVMTGESAIQKLSGGKGIFDWLQSDPRLGRRNDCRDPEDRTRSHRSTRHVDLAGNHAPTGRGQHLSGSL